MLNCRARSLLAQVSLALPYTACLATQRCWWNQASGPEPCLCGCKAQKQADSKVLGAAALLTSPQGHHPWVELIHGDSPRWVARLLVFLAFDQNPPILLKKGCEGRKGRRGPCSEWEEKPEWGPSLSEGGRRTARRGPGSQAGWKITAGHRLRGQEVAGGLEACQCWHMLCAEVGEKTGHYKSPSWAHGLRCRALQGLPQFGGPRQGLRGSLLMCPRPTRSAVLLLLVISEPVSRGHLTAPQMALPRLGRQCGQDGAHHLLVVQHCPFNPQPAWGPLSVATAAEGLLATAHGPAPTELLMLWI